MTSTALPTPGWASKRWQVRGTDAVGRGMWAIVLVEPNQLITMSLPAGESVTLDPAAALDLRTAVAHAVRVARRG